MKFGIDRLLADPALRAPLAGKRVALLAHPASVTADLTHSLDALAACGDIRITAAFGPQHGMRGDKQDNMVETADYNDPQHGIPVFSLYGEVRRPTGQMMSTFDVVFIDLQDLGCRIYTFITTLLYMLEACAKEGKAVWVLDRPNPAGRPIEGLTLRAGWESFVGAGPIPMRHGLTLGELGAWFVKHFKLDVDYRVIAMEGYRPDEAPGYGWPLGERTWINPSPNAPNLWMARAYAGTVMLEGTTLSEGRGTTRPLELFGAPAPKLSEGRCAVPLGMFSTRPTTPTALTRAWRAASASMVPITAPAPAMSHFMSSMPAAGLIEMPPVSKVTPLPMKASGASFALPPFHSITTMRASWEDPWATPSRAFIPSFFIWAGERMEIFSPSLASGFMRSANSTGWR